ncbi:hypothetical protein GQ600_27044 [Phytophthora cactorum]|nr:hypothetical protein GQ600_27044 [Phytophthora cactorum]
MERIGGYVQPHFSCVEVISLQEGCNNANRSSVPRCNRLRTLDLQIAMYNVALKDDVLERILPSLRSAAERYTTLSRRHGRWPSSGWGSVGKVYSRLNLPLPYDQNAADSDSTIYSGWLNYRVRTVGISQIRTTFRGDMEMPVRLSRNLSLD